MVASDGNNRQILDAEIVPHRRMPVTGSQLIGRSVNILGTVLAITVMLCLIFAAVFRQPSTPIIRRQIYPDFTGYKIAPQSKELPPPAVRIPCVADTAKDCAMQSGCRWYSLGPPVCVQGRTCPESPTSTGYCMP